MYKYYLLSACKRWPQLLGQKAVLLCNLRCLDPFRTATLVHIAARLGTAYSSVSRPTRPLLQPVSIWPRNCISLQLSQTVVIWWKLRVLKGGQIESRLAGQERVAHCHTSGSPQNHPNTYPWSKLACKARTNSYGSSGNSRCRKHAKSSGTAVFCDQWSWFFKHPTRVTSWDDSNNSNTVICGILIDICNILPVVFWIWLINCMVKIAVNLKAMTCQICVPRRKTKGQHKTR